MKIIVLAAGFNKRFAEVGYEMPKPCIRVDGEPMIHHVARMFPGGHELLFVCSAEQLATTNLGVIIRDIAPGASVISITPDTRGPVTTLPHLWNHIRDDEPVLITYCDFFMRWDFNAMLAVLAQGTWDGAVPCYTGFHPHLLHRKLYGGVLADEILRMTAFREKHCWTARPEDSFHSVGAYYFSRGRELKYYSEQLLAHGEPVNGEFYVSMVYYGYLADRKRIYVQPVEQFLQWGTPEDLEEYEAWSRLFASGREKGVTDIPAHREQSVHILYPPGSKEYQECWNYWYRFYRDTSGVAPE